MTDTQALALIAVVVWITWSYHGFRAVRSWLFPTNFRASEGYIRFRGAFIGVMVVIGVSLIALGALSRAWPNQVWEDILLVLRPTLYGMLLVGGLVMDVTWWRDR